MVAAFLNAGYNYLHSPLRPMYHLQVLRNGALTVHFVNPLNARLLYGRCYHCCSQMVAFSRANMYTNYESFFPMPPYIHLLRFVDLQLEAPEHQQMGRICIRR